MRSRHSCTAKLGTAEEASLSQAQHASTPMHSTSLHHCTHTGANPGAWALNLHCSTGGRTNGLWNPATAIPHQHQCVCVHQSDIILWICLTLLLHMIQVPRHAGPPYTAHDITKGHPSLAGTPPGHAHSAALSQVSVPTASPYRYPKGWEAGGGVSLSLCPPSSSLHIHCMFNLSICLFSLYDSS